MFSPPYTIHTPLKSISWFAPFDTHRFGPTLSLWPVNAVFCVFIILSLLHPDQPSACAPCILSPEWSSCEQCLLTYTQPGAHICYLLTHPSPWHVNAVSWNIPSLWPVYAVSCGHHRLDAATWPTLSLWPVNAVSCISLRLWPPEWSSSSGCCLLSCSQPVACVCCLLNYPPACALQMLSPEWSWSREPCLLIYPQPVPRKCCLLNGHDPVDPASWSTPACAL